MIVWEDNMKLENYSCGRWNFGDFGRLPYPHQGPMDYKKGKGGPYPFPGCRCTACLQVRKDDCLKQPLFHWRVLVIEIKSTKVLTQEIA